jgi:hypothetical protein
MGRPLAKRFFGNRNVGTTATTDDGIGGEGVASVGSITVGTYAAGATYPGITFDAPSLPGGVSATGTVTVRAKALTAAPSGTQTKAYQVGQVLTLGTNGTTATVATLAAAAAALTTVTVTSISGAIAFDTTGTALLVGTSITVTGTDTAGSGLVPATTYYIKASTVTTATLVSTYAAAISGTGGAIVTVIGATTGLTLTPGNGGAAAAGALATVSTTPTAKGSYVLADTLISAAQATTTTTGGVGATIAVATYEVLSVTVTNSGSGYISVADAAPTFGAGTVAATGASVLTTDSGDVGSSTNQENAIIAYAYVTANSLPADIQAQKGSHRYLVATSEGSAVCKLVGAAAAAVGEMTIAATDASANVYYVTKLTAHRAVLVPTGAPGHLFPATGTNADGTSIYQSVKWSFADTDAWYDAATTVVIANA